MFTFQDERYNRQINMPEWGAAGQEILKNASVAVIGAGGVKSSLLMSIVAAGVGRIRIIEFDKVERSNLNRQILYRTSDIGVKKGYAALKTLQDLNPDIHIDLIDDKLDSNNSHQLLDDYEFIVEGGESPYGRNMVNEFCLKTKKPMLHCSAQFSYGYLFSVIPELKTACFACIFPDDHTRKDHTGAVPVHVLSTSVSGSLGAAEIIKWFIGDREKMYINGKLYFNSLLINQGFEFEQHPRSIDCPVCATYYG